MKILHADTADPAPLPDEQIIRMEGIGQVRLSIETLDERSRELIRLKFTDELSYKDISRAHGNFRQQRRLHFASRAENHRR